MTRLSENFTLDEATRSQTAARKKIKNSPTPIVLGNMKFTARKMEGVRALFGRAVYVSSWYRSPALNRAIGGSPTSAHPKGFAVDFVIHGLSVETIIDRIKNSDIEFDQLINEFGRWVHISFDPRNRRQVFKIG